MNYETQDGTERGAEIEYTAVAHKAVDDPLGSRDGPSLDLCRPLYPCTCVGTALGVGVQSWAGRLPLAKGKA